MKTVLHENHIDCYEMVYGAQKVFEVSGESVVSDKMPDVGLLGETTTHTILHVKQTEDGAGTLEGDLLATVCYIPDGANGYESMEIVIPWSVRFEAEAIKSRDDSIGEVSVVQIETRMLNPRKILVKVQLCAGFSVYEKHTVAVCDDMVENGHEVQIYQERMECNVVGTICEKTFVAADEYPLPPDLIGGKILCKSVQFRVEDVKSLANKLIVKGSTVSDVIITSEQGSAERINMTSGFSFIAETDCEQVSPEVKITMMPTALYYELTSDGKKLSVEVHGVCQMASYRKCEVRYISDVYSNFYACKTEEKNITVYTDVKKTVHREVVTAVIPARSQISCTQFATCIHDMPQQKGKTTQVPVRVSVCVLYENGTQDWLKKSVTVEWKGNGGQKLDSVRVADIYAVSSGTEAEVRVSLEFDIQDEQVHPLRYVSSIETDEEHPYCHIRPCISAVRGCGRLWDLAREYGSTVDLIKTYNELEDDEISAETLLLIPKQMN